MPYRWPEGTEFARWELDVEDRSCPSCGRGMHVCDHRHRRFFTLGGPVHLVCRLNRCPDPGCPAHRKTVSPEAEATIALPSWVLGWDVFCWLGHRRFARRWSVPQIQVELLDSFRITLSDEAIAQYVRRYQAMLAARRQDPGRLLQQYRGHGHLILSIDGLQAERGHETLFVVRELGRKQAWFAEAMHSPSEADVRRLIAQARRWADQLGRPVKLWRTAIGSAFGAGIAAEFPGVPHRHWDDPPPQGTSRPLPAAARPAPARAPRRSSERRDPAGGSEGPRPAGSVREGSLRKTMKNHRS